MLVNIKLSLWDSTVLNINQVSTTIADSSYQQTLLFRSQLHDLTLTYID